MAKPKRYSYTNFRWSEEEYTPKELTGRFGHQMPFLILITQGYMGRDDSVHELAAGEMYWLFDIAMQPRLVVRDTERTYYSIPETYPCLVVPSMPGGTVGRPVSMKQMMKGSWKWFSFLEDDPHIVSSGADCGVPVKLGMLEIIDNYSESFLAVHSLLPEGDIPDPRSKEHQANCTNCIYPEINLIPIYMPIRVAVGMTMSGKKSLNDFYKLMLDINKYALGLSNDQDYNRMFRTFLDILVFEGMPQTGQYEQIHFMTYIKKKKIDVDIDVDTGDPQYEDIPPHEKKLGPVAVGCSPDDTLRKLKLVLLDGIPPPESELSKSKDNTERNKPTAKVPPRVPPKPKYLLCDEATPQTEITDRLRNKSDEPANTKHGIKAIPSTPQDLPPTLPPRPPHLQYPSESLSSLESLTSPELPPKPSSWDTLQPDNLSQGSFTSMWDVIEAEDIPRDISNFSVDDVRRCLELLGLGSHAQMFQNRLVDGQILQNLDEHMLKADFGFNAFEAKQLGMFITDGWRPKMK